MVKPVDHTLFGTPNTPAPTPNEVRNSTLAFLESLLQKETEYQRSCDWLPKDRAVSFRTVIEHLTFAGEHQKATDLYQQAMNSMVWPGDQFERHRQAAFDVLEIKPVS